MSNAPFLFVPTFSWPANPGGLLYTYAAGGTTPQTTYSDAAGTVPNPNPVVLDSTGSATVRLGEGSYHFTLTDPTGATTIWDQDDYDSITADYVAGLLYPTIDAETTSSATIVNPQFIWGDIRRYGAATTASDNSGAINTALLVSSNGGPKAFIPGGGGNWNITSALSAVGSSSMVGDGPASVIVATGCDGIDFPAYSPALGISRVFRDFTLQGSSAASSSNSAISTTVQPAAVSFVDFSNIGLSNWAVAVNAEGFRECTWKAIRGYNCYRAFQFVGQNTNNEIWGCQFNRGSITGTGGAWGLSFASSGGNTTQSTQVSGSYFYFYDWALVHTLAFETQITSCDFSACQVGGAQITNTIGNCVVRDCWIETDNASAVYGVEILNATDEAYADLHICDNHITCDIAAAGTIGISVGAGQSGCRVSGNTINGFDQGILAGASRNLVIRDNRINCVTSVYSATSFALQLNSLAVDATVGPNEIYAGVGQAASIAVGPVVTVTAASAFPIGTPVQVTAQIANGPVPGTTYFVQNSSGTAVQLGAYSGGPAISWSGSGSVGNLIQTPLPVTFTAPSIPPPGLSLFGRGAFQGTLSDPALTGTFNWVASGKLASVAPTGNLTGAAGSTTMTISGLPYFLAAPSANGVNASVENNSAIQVGLSIAAAGSVSGATWTLYPTPAAGSWTNSGTKGLISNAITWAFM